MTKMEKRTMEYKRIVTRREFLRLGAITAASAALAACTTPTEEAPPEEEKEEPEAEPTEKPTEKPAEAPKEEVKAEPTATPTAEPTAEVVKFTDPPMLAPMVAAGELPPVEERLPENPWVPPMLEMTGKSGGTVRRAFSGVSDRWGPTKLGDRGFVWFDKNLIHRPRLADSWTVNDDGSEWTFKLRKGTKWSDGVDFTTKDIQWWYDYTVIDKDLAPTISSMWSTGSEKTPMVLDIPDDYTVTFKFAQPNPLFLLRVGRAMMAAPSHYMKQWHIKTCDDPDALTKAVTDAGFDSWVSYFNDDRIWWYLNRDLPNFRPWIAKNALSEELFVMERNPYFWGVDPDGVQLPYFDKINHRLFETPEVLNLRIVNGEIDFQARHVQAGNYTLYKENEDKGDYKVFVGVSAGHVAVQLNHATKNDQLRAFFQNRNVRIALSHAIDRDLINELIFFGLATPRQYSPLSMSPQYYPKLSNAYIEYNVDEANRLLDEAGYANKDAEGFRTFEDGTTISFTIEGTAQAGSPDEDAVQQVVTMWAAVGVKCAYKYFERALYTEHYQANEIEAAFWGGDRTVLPLAPEAPIFRGTMIDRPWASGYGTFWSDPTNPAAVEPPADHFIWKIWEIWDKVTVEVDPDKQNELFFQILDIWAEEIPMIGVLGELPSLCIVKNGVHNFVEGFPNDDTTGDENVYNTETYFWDDPEAHMG
jgi:peptide/nickel transport system substrate-binding protein